jgi:hypothetical protein
MKLQASSVFETSGAKLVLVGNDDSSRRGGAGGKQGRKFEVESSKESRI